MNIPREKTKKQRRQARKEEPNKAASETANTPERTIEDEIKLESRFRRACLKQQQRANRAMESLIRGNLTEWKPGASEQVRNKANKEVERIIAAARKGEGDTRVVQFVRRVDECREPFDDAKKTHENNMKKLAKLLPVAKWVENEVHGVGLPGLAAIVGEAGDLCKYPHWRMLWKRLGYAPYNGYAMSTYKRPSWCGGQSLTKEDWMENPFSGERYAPMHEISKRLWMAQWIGAEKDENGEIKPGCEGKPNGPYGEGYAERRKHTAITHPDWSKQHSHIDALRVGVMKPFLRALWKEWHRLAKAQSVQATNVVPIPQAKKIKGKIKMRKKAAE